MGWAHAWGFTQPGDWSDAISDTRASVYIFLGEH